MSYNTENKTNHNQMSSYTFNGMIPLQAHTISFESEN
jgi:hypothetical protein